MKIAVSAKGCDLDAQVDPRFGRASYILVVDTDTLEVEVIDNQTNKNAFKGAGIHAASAICDKGAQILLTGFCGPNAFRTLAAAGVKVVNNMSGTVKDALQEFNNDRVSFAEDANVEGHW